MDKIEQTLKKEFRKALEEALWKGYNQAKKEILDKIKLYFDMCGGARRVPRWEELKKQIKGK